MYQPLADLLRPQTLDEYIGQEKTKNKGFIERKKPENVGFCLSR